MAKKNAQSKKNKPLTQIAQKAKGAALKVKAKKIIKKSAIVKSRSQKKPGQKSGQNEFQVKLGEMIWPAERDILFRPDRYRYVRKMIKGEGCVFCTARDLDMSINTLCVYQSHLSMIVLNKFPYNSGHLLVIPKEHCGDILQLSDEVYFDLQKTVKLAMRAIQDIYSPGGFNIGVNHGACAGAGIPEHLHYHIIPRWYGDVNFFPMIAETKVVIESLEQTYEKFEKYFKELK